MLHFVPYNFPVQAVSCLGHKSTTESGLLACWFVVSGFVLFCFLMPEIRDGFLWFSMLKIKTAPVWRSPKPRMNIKKKKKSIFQKQDPFKTDVINYMKEESKKYLFAF